MHTYMGTSVRLLSPPPVANKSTIQTLNHSPTSSLFSLPIRYNKNSTASRRMLRRVQSTSMFGHDFLDGVSTTNYPESNQEFSDFDLSWFNPSEDRSRFDVIVIGTGPSGLRLAELVSGRGIKVCCVDPSPLSIWPNNYGVWVDEFESLGLEYCLDKTWPVTSVYIDDHRTKNLDRPFGRVNRKKLKATIMENCVDYGVKFHKAKVSKIKHEEHESSIICDDGTELKASLVVDASGFASTFVEYNKPRNPGYQVGLGILAEVENHPFDLDKMVLTDYRDSHLKNEPHLQDRNSKFPTFLYAMPLESNLIFLEEASMCSRPALSHLDIKSNMVARLRHLGIRVKRVIEHEKCLIPMGGPLPIIPQRVVAIGGTSGLVHPSTGNLLASTLAVAPALADAIAECLGSTRMIRGRPVCQRVWNELWPIEKRFIREIYCYGMEAMLKLDLNETRRLFSAFFDVNPYYWQGFLSSRLSFQDFFMFAMLMHGRL